MIRSESCFDAKVFFEQSMLKSPVTMEGTPSEVWWRSISRSDLNSGIDIFGFYICPRGKFLPGHVLIHIHTNYDGCGP